MELRFWKNIGLKQEHRTLFYTDLNALVSMWAQHERKEVMHLSNSGCESTLQPKFHFELWVWLSHHSYTGSMKWADCTT